MRSRHCTGAAGQGSAMKENRSSEVLELFQDVRFEPLCRGQMPDCRLFLLGDRLRQLLRAYPEVIYRLSRNGASSSPGDLLESAEIRQYYEVSHSNGRLELTLRDSAFREQYPLDSDDFALRISRGSRAVMLPLPLEQFRAVGVTLPLLMGNHSDAEVTTLMQELLLPDEQQWSRRLLATLTAEGWLRRHQIRPNSFLVSQVRPRVTFVGHTSIL